MRYMEACSSNSIVKSFPSEYHEEVKINGSKIAVLRDILCQHYNIPTEGQLTKNLHESINVFVEKESIERSIGATDIIRDIVWKYYGHDSSPTKSNHKYTKQLKNSNLEVRQKYIDERNEVTQKKKIRHTAKKVKQTQKKNTPTLKIIDQECKKEKEIRKQELKKQKELKKLQLKQEEKIHKQELKKQKELQHQQELEQERKIREEKRLEELQKKKELEKIQHEQELVKIQQMRQEAEKQKQQRIKKEKQRRQEAKQERAYQREVNKVRLDQQLRIEWRNWVRELNKIERDKQKQEKSSRPVSESMKRWLEQKAERDKKKQQEKELEEKLLKEKENLRDKVGIEKYYTPIPDNPVDQEILRRIRDRSIQMNYFVNNSNCNKATGGEERVCRSILAKRLGRLFNYSDNERTYNVIISRIEARCKRQNKSWNDVVRELFCIEFNLKC